MYDFLQHWSKYLVLVDIIFINGHTNKLLPRALRVLVPVLRRVAISSSFPIRSREEDSAFLRYDFLIRYFDECTNSITLSFE